MMRYLKIIVWTFVIAYLCFAPANEFRKVNISIPHFDKLVHFGMFFIAGLFISARAKFSPIFLHRVGLPVFFVFYAGAIEIIQHNYIYGRSGDWLDWLADVVGLFLSMYLFRFVPGKIQRFL